MSDRPCNFCSLRDLRARYGNSNVKVREDMGMPAAFVNGKPVAWFMALPESCACDEDGD